tara:strand:+ start:878 stop:1096 length:219 start_codon:yes stop_codon:yes gene_type:complete
MKKNLLTIFLIFMVNTDAYAYLDPGAGSSILQIILAFLAGIGAFLSVYWNKFKFLIRKIFNKSSTDKEEKKQ